MQTIVSIPGMHCASCAALIKDVSSEFSQIQKVDVDIAAKKVTIEHGMDLPFEAWKAEIEALGDAYTIHLLPK